MLYSAVVGDACWGVRFGIPVVSVPVAIDPVADRCQIAESNVEVSYDGSRCLWIVSSMLVYPRLYEGVGSQDGIVVVKSVGPPIDNFVVYGVSLAQDGEDVKSCLLYTSPSPRDATLSRMPSSA